MFKKLLVLVLEGAGLMSAALADTGEVMGSGMMFGTTKYGMMGWGWMSLWGLFWLILVSFVFSVIFWLCYKWIVKNKKTKRK